MIGAMEKTFSSRQVWKMRLVRSKEYVHLNTYQRIENSVDLIPKDIKRYA